MWFNRWSDVDMSCAGRPLQGMQRLRLRCSACLQASQPPRTDADLHASQPTGQQQQPVAYWRQPLASAHVRGLEHAPPWLAPQKRLFLWFPGLTCRTRHAPSQVQHQGTPGMGTPGMGGCPSQAGSSLPGKQGMASSDQLSSKSGGCG